MQLEQRGVIGLVGQALAPFDVIAQINPSKIQSAGEFNLLQEGVAPERAGVVVGIVVAVQGADPFVENIDQIDGDEAAVIEIEDLESEIPMPLYEGGVVVFRIDFGGVPGAGLVFVAVVFVKQLQMLTGEGGVLDDGLQTGIFAQDAPLGFARRVAAYIDFQTLAFAALLTDGAEKHRTKAPPAVQNKRFALLSVTLLDDLVVDGLGVTGDVGARLVERALFEHRVVVIRRHLCG